ncbi:MAG: DUF503 domain-containing protein [Burkholderiales bacterium]|nr:DUF503 domain-containing protein [Phycisphaerae bacterium]
MHVGILQLDLMIPEALTLKDKRRVILSLKDRIANSHNVSVAEVDRLDEHKRSIIGIAMVSNDKRYVEGGLSKIVDMVRMNPGVNLVDYQIEFA